MTERDVPRRIASRFQPRALRGYVRWKLRTDPVYDAVAARFRGRTAPVVDVGCGVGLLSFYLREDGFEAPIVGLDFDERKIAAARNAATRYSGIDFIAADARAPLPEAHDVVMLDLLQYFDATARREILGNVARAVGPGGLVAIRQGIRDSSWRYRATSIVDFMARTLRWLKADRLEFPTAAEIVGPFADFESEVLPMWGRTPFNNYLFIFRRRAAGNPQG